MSEKNWEARRAAEELIGPGQQLTLDDAASALVYWLGRERDTAIRLRRALAALAKHYDELLEELLERRQQGNRHQNLLNEHNQVTAENEALRMTLLRLGKDPNGRALPKDRVKAELKVWLDGGRPDQLSRKVRT